jgi:hypothetical protein
MRGVAFNKQEFIRAKAQASLATPNDGAVLWSRAAIAELYNLNVSRVRVLEAMQLAQLIVDFPPLHSPLPDGLVLLKVRVDLALHALMALDQTSNTAVVVKVYRPTLEEWQDGWRKRAS